ncbi:MAG: LysE family translocator [Pseudomonadota bacterium]
MSLVVAMAVFSVSMSISPGPVNLIALTSGINCGLARSIRFITGATVGFTALLVLVGFGFGELNSTFPVNVSFLKYLGCAYIFYIGCKVFFDTGAIEEATNKHKPPSFSQGILMQWLNPKAWIACVAGTSAFDVYASNERFFLFIIIYFGVCYLGIASWTILGQKIQIWINTKGRIQTYNRTMGMTLCTLSVFLLGS